MTALRERLAALNSAIATETDAILRGETTQDEATDRLVERFLPRLGGIDRDPQPARMPETTGGAH